MKKKESPVQKEESITEWKVEELIKFENEFDPSVIFTPGHLGYDKNDLYMAWIIHSLEGNYLVGCWINKKESTMKLFYLCDNSDITLSPDQELNIEGLKNVMKKITSKDVVPHDLPISLIWDFKTFANLFIFSFVLFTSVSTNKRQLEYWMSTKGI